MPTRRQLAALTTCFVSTLALLGGCASTPSEEQLSDIRSDPAPELMTLNQRPDDVENQLVITNNTNARAFWNDMGRAFYTDRPSRLTPQPTR